MHYKTTLLAVVLTVFTQVSSAGFSIDIFNEIPLTTDCGGSVPIADGDALVRVLTVYGNQWPEGSGFGQAPVSQWLINGNEQLGIPGGFHTVGGFSVPWMQSFHETIFYMVVDYPAVNPVYRWTSEEIWVVPGVNPDHYCSSWTCQYDPPPCDPSLPDTVWMQWDTEWESCVPFCSETGSTKTVCLGPFPLWCEQLYPDAGYAPFWVSPEGSPCSPFYNECNPIQVVGYWYESSPGQFWICGDYQLPPGSSSGYAKIALDFPLGGGPQADCWLPVELLSFTAVPQDRSVVLSWATGSETDMSHFEIIRDGATIANVPATNSSTGSTYQWRDGNLENGREYFYTLTSVDFDGSSEQVGQLHATPRADEVPSEFSLLQNYPNPFNASTTIEFVLPEASDISLTLHNLLGENVAMLAEGATTAGSHRVNLDAASLSSGIYFYRLSAGSFTAQKKLVLIK